MKIISVFLLLLACYAASGQTIPNAGFEVWDYYNTWTLEPEGWDTPNNQLIETVTQDLSAYEGQFAMKVHVLGAGPNVIRQMAAVTVPATAVGSQLVFAVKCNVSDSDVLDQVVVGVEYLFEDATLWTGEWDSGTSIMDWELHSINLPQPDLPIDAVRIFVAAGYTTDASVGGSDTWISVDAMSFGSGEGVSDSTLPFTSTLFPNPCHGEVNVRSLSAFDAGTKFRWMDQSGRVLLETGPLRQMVLPEWPAGVYYLLIERESGAMSRHRLVVF